MAKFPIFREGSLRSEPRLSPTEEEKTNEGNFLESEAVDDFLRESGKKQENGDRLHMTG